MRSRGGCCSRSRDVESWIARSPGSNRRVSDLIETHGPDIEAVGEKLLSKSIKAAIDLLPDDVLDVLGRIREEFTGVIERVFYESFQFDSEVTIGALDLGIPGVNVSVEDAMGTVSDWIDDGSLGGEWDEERNTGAEQVCEEIRWREVAFVGGMKTAEDGADWGGVLGLIAAMAALGLFAIGICIGATGVGLALGGVIALIAAKLKLVAAALGKIALALTVSISIVGIAFLTWTANRHDETVVGLVAPDPIAHVVSR